MQGYFKVIVLGLICAGLAAQVAYWNTKERVAPPQALAGDAPACLSYGNRIVGEDVLWFSCFGGTYYKFDMKREALRASWPGPDELMLTQGVLPSPALELGLVWLSASKEPHRLVVGITAEEGWRVAPEKIPTPDFLDPDNIVREELLGMVWRGETLHLTIEYRVEHAEPTRWRHHIVEHVYGANGAHEANRITPSVLCDQDLSEESDVSPACDHAAAFMQRDEKTWRFYTTLHTKKAHELAGVASSDEIVLLQEGVEPKNLSASIQGCRVQGLNTCVQLAGIGRPFGGSPITPTIAGGFRHDQDGVLRQTVLPKPPRAFEEEENIQMAIETAGGHAWGKFRYWKQDKESGELAFAHQMERMVIVEEELHERDRHGEEARDDHTTTIRARIDAEPAVVSRSWGDRDRVMTGGEFVPKAEGGAWFVSPSGYYVSLDKDFKRIDIPARGAYEDLIAERGGMSAADFRTKLAICILGLPLGLLCVIFSVAYYFVKTRNKDGEPSKKIASVMFAILILWMVEFMVIRNRVLDALIF